MARNSQEENACGIRHEDKSKYRSQTEHELLFETHN
jgi:hypothetical protein